MTERDELARLLCKMSGFDPDSPTCDDPHAVCRVELGWELARQRRTEGWRHD